MKTIEDIIIEKNYSDLSVEELNLVSELAGNEDEFNQMKQLFENMSMEFDGAEVFAPASATKASLDQIFSAKHPVIANEWKKEDAVAEETKVVALYNRTWLRIAAIFLLFIGISVLFIKNSDELSKNNGVKTANNNVQKTELKEKSALYETVATPGTKTNKETIIYPNDQEKESNVPELALSEDRLDDAEMNKDVTKTLYSPVANGATYYDKFSSNENAYTFSATTSQPPAYSFSSGHTTTFKLTEEEKKSNWGHLADLDPSLNMSEATTTGAVYGSSVSKEGLAAEMLDWIQAAY